MALEIFINKTFSVYEQKLVHELTSKSKNLVYKFSVIASLLSSESSDARIQQFKRIKKIRDRLVHRGEYEEASLPNLELRDLLIGYLRRHLDYISQ